MRLDEIPANSFCYFSSAVVVFPVVVAVAVVLVFLSPLLSLLIVSAVVLTVVDVVLAGCSYCC